MFQFHVDELLMEAQKMEKTEVQQIWKTHIKTIKNSQLNDNQHGNESTLSIKTLLEACKEINNFFQNKNLKLRILDPLCGNMVASEIYHSNITKCVGYTCSDICDYGRRSNLPFEQLDSIDSVRKFGKSCNVLLLSSPCPSVMEPEIMTGDYHACDEFIKQTTAWEEKYIIFVGEMSLGDGCEFLNRFLTKHKRLQLVVCEIIFQKQFAFGMIHKCVYIYKIGLNINK